MSLAIPIEPAQGGKLRTRFSAERAGVFDYVVKRDFRRELDQEIRREGYDYAWFVPSHNLASQPFPQNQPDAPAVSLPIYLIHEACAPDGERAIIAGTETDLYVFYPGLGKHPYVEPGETPDDRYLDETWVVPIVVGDEDTIPPFINYTPDGNEPPDEDGYGDSKKITPIVPPPTIPPGNPQEIVTPSPWPTTSGLTGIPIREWKEGDDPSTFVELNYEIWLGKSMHDLTDDQKAFSINKLVEQAQQYISVAKAISAPKPITYQWQAGMGNNAEDEYDGKEPWGWWQTVYPATKYCARVYLQ